MKKNKKVFVIKIFIYLPCNLILTYQRINPLSNKSIRLHWIYEFEGFTFNMQLWNITKI